jgi:RHS repeat-associated protein
VYNAHGDVVQLCDDDGNVIKTYDYDPYGNQLQDVDSTDANPYRYCGEYYDIESGYTYLRARYYDSSIGRFISEDPAMDGYNWYVYCGNNPVMYVDPSGMIPIPLIIAALAGLTAFGLTGCSNSNSNTPNALSPLAPAYEPDNWNSDKYINNTNCYAYAFNMLENPLTGKKFPEGGMQPGMASGQFPLKSPTKGADEYLEILSGTTEGNQKLVDMVTADSKALGLDFLPYNKSLTGGYAVALAVKPGIDYHWYRENGNGTWSHKPGRTKATNQETMSVSIGGSESLQYGDVITNPKEAGIKAGYTEFLGYYYLRPAGSR